MDLRDDVEIFEEALDDLENMVSGNADEFPCANADEHQSENDTVSPKSAEECEVSVEQECSGGTSSGISADSASYASVVQGHSGSPVDTPGATGSDKSSIMEFSESSDSQSILGPKVPRSAMVPVIFRGRLKLV